MQNLNENSTQGLVGDISSQRHHIAGPQDSMVTVHIAAQHVPNRQNQGIRNSSLRITAFTKADWDLAVRNAQKKGNRFYKGEELGMTTDVEHFHMYGPGVSLFFYFQKYLIFALLAMSLLSLIPTIFNYLSGSKIVGQGTTLAYYFGGTTIGNFSTSSSYSNSYKLVNTITDMVNIFIFIVFYFFWLKRGSDITSKIKNMIKLKCYTVIELVEFAQGVTVQDVKKFISRFGPVVQIAPVRNYDETISLSKKIYELEIQLKELEIKKQQTATNGFEQKITQLKLKIDELYNQLVLYDNDKNKQILKFYINFASIQDRQYALRQLQKYKRKLCLCCEPTPEQFLLKGQRVTVRPCHTEPTDILWQNQHVDWSTRWLRVLIQSLLLLIALTLGFLMLSFLNILVPASTTNVSTSSYTSTTILSQTNTTIVQSWCITNQISVLEAGSSSAIYTFCWSYIFQYFLKILITIGISVAVVIIKFILNKFILFLSRFKRYKTQSEQSRDIVLSLFLVYLATTLLITFLLQAYILGISFKNFIQDFISNSYLLTNSQSLNSYEDFLSSWYLQIGYQIAFNCFTMAIHPALTMPLVLCILQKYKFWKAKDQEVQANMQKALQPAQFEIENNYADLLVIIFIGLAFSGGAPIVTIICFLAVTFRYFYFKHLFYRYCKIPKTFDEALDNLVASILPFGIFIHFAFSIWMFGATSIFQSDTTISIDFGTSNFVQSVSFIFQRLLGTYYYSIFFILFVLIWIFKALVYNFLIKLFIGQQKRQMVTAVKVETSESTGEFVQNVVTSKSLCDSYQIQNNPDYVQVLQIMKKKNRRMVKVKQVNEVQT